MRHLHVPLKSIWINSRKYRANPVKLNHFIKPELILNYAMVDEGVPLIADDIVIEVNRKTLSNPRTFVGIEIEVPICQLVGGETTGIAIVEELWMKLGSQRHNIPNQIPGGNEFCSLYGKCKRRKLYVYGRCRGRVRYISRRI